LLANFYALVGDWHTARRVIPSKYAPAMFALLFMAAGIALMALQVTTNFDAVKWFSSRLPESLGGTIAVSVLLLGALIWAIDRVFQGVEFAETTVPGAQL
jgi:hypothetical protein